MLGEVGDRAAVAALPNPPGKDPIPMKAIPLNKILIVGAALLLVTTGCKRKEKVLDVKTPAGGIEVERDKDTGAVDIKIDEKK